MNILNNNDRGMGSSDDQAGASAMCRGAPYPAMEAKYVI